MAPKVSTMEALQVLADQEGNGLLTERGEFVMDEAMHAVVKAMAAELGGLGARSKVVRRLITKGARVELAERQAKAQAATAAQEGEDPEEARKAARRERDRRRREALEEARKAARRERDRRRREALAAQASQA